MFYSRFKNIIVRFIVVIMVFVCISFSISINAQNSTKQGLVLTPAIVELDAERGSNYNLEINLTNDDEALDYRINTLLQGFKAGQEEGVPVVSDLTSDSPYLKWVDFKNKTFDLKKGEKTKSEVTVNIPENAQPGSHYLALTYAVDNQNQDQANKSKVKINQRIGVLLFLNIKGQVQREVAFDYINADKNLYDPFFDGIKVEYKINVSGNAYLKPNGNIYLGNDSAKPEATLSLNPEQKIILPNSARTFKFLNNPKIDIPLLSTPVEVQNSTNTDLTQKLEVDFPRPWFGSQKVEVRVLYVNSQSELTQKSIFLELNYFPWKTLILISPLFLTLLIYIVYKYNKSRNLLKKR